MPLLSQGGGGGAGSQGQGVSGSGVDYDVSGEIERLRDQLNQIGVVLEDLRVKYNAHVHVENTAPAYTQNASTNAVVAASQSTERVIV